MKNAYYVLTVGQACLKCKGEQQENVTSVYKVKLLSLLGAVHIYKM